MKCTSNSYSKKAILFSILLVVTVTVTGCGGTPYDLPYTADSDISSFRVVNLEEEKKTADTFASKLCVVDANVNEANLDMVHASSAALFDINDKNVIYAKNVHEQLYPASLTKVMTALVALKHGSGDMLLTASANVKIQESGAQVCGIKEGDQMTLAQALHLLLINSANDAAVLIAEGIAGSVDAFADMMNEEALRLGATNTHFVNPHGLSDENHYTTVYDMYLIMNEAIQYDLFNEIIRMDTYTTVYQDKSGADKEITVNSTNYFFTGKANAPSGVTVIGGKTGTTDAAGHCLVLVSRDSSSKPYISVVMRSDSRDNLYQEMTDLLGQING